MEVELAAFETRVVLSDQPWHQGIQHICLRGREVPFLLPALSGHHFFTGQWPLPPEAVEYEPHVSPARSTQLAEAEAEWHQPATPYTRVETRIRYRIIEPGTVEVGFETRSHADTYPFDYVALFFGTVMPPGGQRGMHLVVPDAEGYLRWRYFQGGGDSDAPRSNTVLGPKMPPAEHSPSHPSCYFFSEARGRFAIPIQMARWHDLSYCLEVDTDEVAFTDVLMGTAIGAPSWDVYWRLRPGERRRVRCRLRVAPWAGWDELEARYRSWEGCRRDFKISRPGVELRQQFRPAEPYPRSASSGLALSQRLFETEGLRLLESLGLQGACSVGCFGGRSQNARLDDEFSRDHIWGPYLTFLLPDEAWRAHGNRLKSAAQQMPEEVDGVRWTGYDGPRPRGTEAWELGAFLQHLTGLDKRPVTDREWLPYLSRSSFLGRRMTEQLFDAGQGEIFHDPEKRFTTLWWHWTGYFPPDIHRAVLARSLFRVWNAGPEYNLGRMRARGDRVGFALCRARFVDEVLELAFGWNERFVPHFKWRSAQFRRLPICPRAVEEGVEALSASPSDEETLEISARVVRSIKLLARDLYHLETDVDRPLSAFAHEVLATVEDPVVRDETGLDW